LTSTDGIFGTRNAKATESWAWLGLVGKTPIFTFAFGDIFFTAADGFWFLDTVEGTLTRPWRTADDLRCRSPGTPTGRDVTGVITT
jgi:hypothetical protein